MNATLEEHFLIEPGFDHAEETEFLPDSGFPNEDWDKETKQLIASI